MGHLLRVTLLLIVDESTILGVQNVLLLVMVLINTKVGIILLLDVLAIIQGSNLILQILTLALQAPSPLPQDLIASFQAGDLVLQLLDDLVPGL